MVPPNKMVFGDPNLCVGCHSCEVACALAHSAAANVHEAASMSGLVARVEVVRVGAVNVPMQCRQCENAPCARVCPVGAMRQNDGQGAVWVDEEACIGCKMCTVACPFGAVQVVTRPAGGPTNGGVAVKCDLCVEWRARKGESRTACEAACPTRAISFVNIEDYRTARVDRAAASVALTNSNRATALRGQ